MCDIRVSVIIPIYNAQRHLQECLDACLKQTLKQIEIICVNDGSTDNTAVILEQYAREYTNIVILNQKNQGPGVARNSAIEFAHGEFIAFMDSDDYYPNRDALQKLYEAAVEEKVAVCGGTAFFMNDGKIDESNTGLSFRESTIMHYRKFQRAGGFTQYIYNTQFLRKNKILFPTWRWYEDPPFFVEAMTKAERFYVISDWVYVVRNTDKIVQFYDKNIVAGIINGIGTVLKISRENRLEVLHGNIVADLTVNFIACIYKQIYCGNAKIRQEYEKLLTEIDETLLEKSAGTVKKPKAVSDEEIAQIFALSLKKEQALLDKVNSFAEILIYGAGRAGRLLYQYLNQRECKANIEFMISAENPNYTACGKQVYSIRECTAKKNSAIVIIANLDHIDQMEEMARYYQFRHIEAVSWEELMFFGSDMLI